MRVRALVAVGVLAVAALTLVSETSRAVGPFSFPHAPHLSEATVDAGLRAAATVQAGGRPAAMAPDSDTRIDADCVVCHDYAKAADAHLGGCAQCHVGDAYLEVRRTDGTDVAAGARSPFPHAEHMRDESITCLSCHQIRIDHDWVEFTVPAPALGPRGSDGAAGGAQGDFTCADCHAEHEPLGGLVTQDATTGDGRKCADCHLTEGPILPLRYRSDVASGTRPFLHADHGGAVARCDSCHGDIRESETIWDYDPTLATAERCISCHIADADGTPLIGVRNPARESRVPFVQFSRFPHSTHMDPPGTTETSGQVTAACRTCHYPETDDRASRMFPARGSGETEPLGRAALVEYRTCVPCHSDWRVANHGVGAWSCFKCHTGVADADGSLPIATATVERADLGQPTWTRHHHPGITKAGAELSDYSQPDDQVCADCHKGDLEAVTSRTGGKPFAHGPHLTDDPGNDECLACHSTAATTSWSEDLRRFETHSGASTGASALGAARGCLACHVGATADELGVEPAASRQVPQFDHRSHVTAGSFVDGMKGIACVECHESSEDGAGREYGVLPADVVDCTRCHSHDEADSAKFGRTGPATSEGESEKCLFCHEAVQESSPARIERTRTHLDLLDGVQWHDRGGDCAACHERDGLSSERPDYRERITKARVRKSIHDDPALAGEWFNDPTIARGGDGRGRTCLNCHRSEPRGYLRSLRKR